MQVEQMPVTDAMELNYNSLHKDGIVNMAFHQVFEEGANSNLKRAWGIKGSKCSGTHMVQAQ